MLLLALLLFEVFIFTRHWNTRALRSERAIPVRIYQSISISSHSSRLLIRYFIILYILHIILIYIYIYLYFIHCIDQNYQLSCREKSGATVLLFSLTDTKWPENVLCNDHILLYTWYDSKIFPLNKTQVNKNWI